jgi:ABC-type transport system involved in multi-copper enzyme maturation permease subunit
VNKLRVGGQIFAIVRLEWKKSLFGRRAWWAYLPAALPVMLTASHSLAMWLRGRWIHTMSTDSRIFAGLFQIAYLRMGIYLGCAIVFTNLFRGDMLSQTLHYYLLAPVRREALVAGKYLAGLIAVLLLFGASVMAGYCGTFLHFGPQFQEFLFRGGGLAHLGAYVGVTVLASIGYGAVFLAAGLVFRNPMAPAAVILVWEGINAFLPPALQKLSVIFYLKSLLPVELPETGPLAVLAAAMSPAPAWQAILGLLLVASGALAYAAVRARRLEIQYGE